LARHPPSSPTRRSSDLSFSGALIARELAVRIRRPAPDDDMVAGLLRNLGALLMQKAYPDAWQSLQARPVEQLLTARCEAEEAALDRKSTRLNSSHSQIS